MELKKWRTIKEKVNPFIVFGFGVFAFLYFASKFLIPFTFAVFLATLMRPVSNQLEKWGFNRIWSSAVSTLMVLVISAIFLVSLTSQLKFFSNELPAIEENLRRLAGNVQIFISENFKFSIQQQEAFIKSKITNLSSALEEAIKNFISGFASTILLFLLTMIYLFLLLLKRGKYEEFVLMYVSSENQEKAKALMERTTYVAGQYLRGRLKVISILTLLYFIAFLAFGIRYSLILLIFAAALTIIPYLGAFLSGLIPILIAFLSDKDFSLMVSFSIVIIIIQLIESYVLEPIIIGSEVHLSPLSIIVMVVVGGYFWGIPGMILFVPLLAAIKIVCDHFDELKPIGFLVGNTRSSTDNGILEKIKKIFTKKRGS